MLPDLLREPYAMKAVWNLQTTHNLASITRLGMFK